MNLSLSALRIQSDLDSNSEPSSQPSSPAFQMPSVIRRRTVIQEETSIERREEVNSFNEKRMGNKECMVFTDKEIIGSGAFGVTAIKNDYVYKIIANFTKPYEEVNREDEWNWIFNRYKNFGSDMNKYTEKTSELFPENFMRITESDVGYCTSNNDVSLYVKMPLVSNMIPGNLSTNLSKLNENILNLLFAQVYYIAMKTNTEDLFHNDFKPANIVLKKADNDFEYNSIMDDGRVLIIKIKKGDYIPVIIDYDLVSFQHMQDDLSFYDFPASDSTSDDFEYFKQKIISKGGREFSDNPILSLAESSDDFVFNKTYRTFLQMLGEDRVELRVVQGGGGKGIRRQKKSKRTPSKKVKKIKKVKKVKKIKKKSSV